MPIHVIKSKRGKLKKISAPQNFLQKYLPTLVKNVKISLLSVTSYPV